LFAAACAAVLMAAPPAGASEPPTVVASIKPINSLVAAVMGEVGSPHLIVKGAASPHTASLRPSDAAALQSADLVVWVGPDLELFLENSIATLSGDAIDLRLEDLDGVTILPPRVGGDFETHHHHADHDDDHDDHAEHEHEHDEHEHEHDEAHAIDPHMWLDPANAEVMVRAIAEALTALDPDHADTYRANATATEQRLATLISDVTAELAPVKNRPFIVFHDAYQYFEHRFGLHAAGSVTVRPDTSPGAARLTEIKNRIDQTGAACVFAEPQFEPSLVRVIAEGTHAHTGTLDPLGADLPDGPDLYVRLLHDLATSMRACLEQ